MIKKIVYILLSPPISLSPLPLSDLRACERDKQHEQRQSITAIDSRPRRGAFRSTQASGTEAVAKLGGDRANVVQVPQVSDIDSVALKPPPVRVRLFQPLNNKISHKIKNKITK